MGGQAAKGGKQRASARRNRTEENGRGEPRNLLKNCDLVGKIGRDCREGDADHVKVGRLLLRTTRPQRRPRSGFEALKKPGFGADFSGVQFPARVYPSSIACCWEWDRF